MIEKSNTKWVILISFSIVLLLLVALVAIAVKSISDNQRQVIRLEQNSEIETHVNNMRDAAQKRTLLLFHMTAVEDAFDRDDIWMDFKSNAEKYIIAKDALQATDFDKNVKQHLNDALESSGPGSRIQNKVAALLIEDDDTTTAIRMLNDEMLPVQTGVMRELTNLLNAVKDSIDVSINDLSSKNKFSIMLIAILGSAALMLGIIITIYVTRHTVRSENDFIEQKMLAEQASEAKSMFLANMSHEIRSPLTAIIGFSDSILNRNLTEEKKKELNRSIVKNSKHLHQIINDILDISKIEAGQLELEIISTPVRELFSELTSMVELQTSRKGLEFHVNYEFPLPEIIDTDPTRLKQVLVNLSNNALKFTQHGNITVAVSYEPINKKLHFSVSDTGIGMTDEQAKNVFSAFSQADTSTTRKFGGTGLGLSISKQLVEKLGGEISCSSTPEKGSCFSFFIDIGDNQNLDMIHDQESFDAEISSQIDTFFEHLTGNVLLGEDLIDNQDLIQMYVEDTGASITIADNGKLAVKACEQSSFDLIFMDMQMPVMDGVEAITKIRALGVKTPIVSLTANALKSDVDKCMNAGANDFLSKPIDVNKFNQVLSKYLKPAEVPNPKEMTPNIIENKQKKRSQKMEKLVNRFLDELPNRIVLINDSKDQENWRDLKMETHKLKGLGTTMGFPELTKLCSQINDHCNDESYEQVPELVLKLSEYTKSIL